MDGLENCQIGSRIICDGYKGTVKYIGVVGNTKGQWLGIDWDDPNRGKHNGTYESTKYFDARSNTSGSFIRPGKAKFGISCPCAIKIRYGLVDDDLAGVDKESISSLQKKLNAPFLEMVGFSKVNKKQSKFNQLEIVCLRGQCVSDAGNPNELEELCPNLKELDLSNNLINSWNIVLQICSQLHSLTHLDISENYLPIDNLEKWKDMFTINSLTMTNMNYNWYNVEQCIIMFSTLKELVISSNQIDVIGVPIEIKNWQNLQRLSLEGNQIKDWEYILKLASFTSLEYLNLNSNQLSSLWFPTKESAQKTFFFSKLKNLQICENKITEWKSISELDKLCNLEELKLRENPILKNESLETGRQLIIARIGNLKMLNGTEITSDERKGAEYDYMKLFILKWLESEKDCGKRNEFISQHPRYPTLVTKYGVADIPILNEKREMASNVITVEFVSTNESNEQKRVKRKLLKDMEVQKIIGLAQRLFRTNGNIPSLSFVQKNLSKDEIPLDKPLQELRYYSIQDGDQIFVKW